MQTAKWLLYKTTIENMNVDELRAALMQAYTVIDEQTALNGRLQAQIDQRTAIDTVLAAIRPQEFQLDQ